MILKRLSDRTLKQLIRNTHPFGLHLSGDPSISQLTPDEGLLRGDIFSFCLMCYDLLTQRKDRPKEGSEADYSQIAINKLKEDQDFLLSQEKKLEKNQSNKEVEKHDKEQDKDQLLKSSEDNQAEEEKKKKRKQIKKTFGDHPREWIELLLEGLKNREESISWFVNQLSLLYED